MAAAEGDDDPTARAQLPSLNGPKCRIAPRAVVADVDTTSPKTLFVNADRPLQMTNASKALVWYAVYKPYGEVAPTVRGAMAQRLVRRLCPQCSQPVALDQGQVERLAEHANLSQCIDQAENGGDQQHLRQSHPTDPGAGCGDEFDIAHSDAVESSVVSVGDSDDAEKKAAGQDADQRLHGSRQPGCKGLGKARRQKAEIEPVRQGEADRIDPARIGEDTGKAETKYVDQSILAIPCDPRSICCLAGKITKSRSSISIQTYSRIADLVGVTLSPHRFH
ncbi:hypothetical protein [Bosea vaviloviae]|uniref:hypothetical protein n=1 Tax=Bosea vaviloviae TaxID=1526658 RepID=UPI000B11D474|nr:hypothetical protein [Bosea vaviloviae]